MSRADEVEGGIKYVPSWSRYDHQEFFGRLSILVDEINHVHKSQGRTNKTELDLQAEAVSWAYHLETVPTNYLGRACQRAIQAWRSPYMMPASAVLSAWDDISAELTEGYGPPVEGGGVPALPNAALPPGYDQPWDSFDVQRYITLKQFKELHKLPPEWKWGEPYPEGSDLHGHVPPPLYAYFPVLPDQPRFDPVVQPEARWRRRTHAPWELYGSPEHPMMRDSVRKVTTKDSRGYESVSYQKTRVVSWVERCPTIDFGPDVECPGYVTEYIVTTVVTDDGDGPSEERQKRHQCPIHPRMSPRGYPDLTSDNDYAIL